MKICKLFILVFTCNLLLLPPAHAADNKVEHDKNGTLIMEKVTVTASKREGSLKDFPGNISVMDDMFMETRGVNNLGNLMRFTPNLYVKDTSSGGSLICRGVSTIDTSFFSPMGLYVDDIPYPMGYMTNQNLFDVERVEVLRGPQGTLYGRNSESGVTNIVLKKPDNEQRNKMLLEAGNYNTARLGISSSGPITEGLLFYGITLQGYTTKGYYENILDDDDDVTGQKTFDGRGTLRWTPSRDWDISLNVDGSARDKGISALRYTDGIYKTDRYEVTSNESDKAYENELGQSAKIKHSWSNLELTSITSHRNFDREHHLDSDRTPNALGYSDLDAEMDSWNQELRLNSTDKSNLSWLLGLNGRYETVDAGIAFTHVNPLLTSKRSGDNEDMGLAVFGQATYEITPDLRLTGGMRVDGSHNSGKGTYTPNTGPISYKDDVDAVEWLPMLSLAYDFTPHVTAYSTVSRGFLAGGFNFYSATDEDSFSYDAEHVTNYEVGVKTNWLENTLTLNTTLFYMDITDKQVREEVAGAGTGVWKFTNAAEAHTKGIELDGRYRPIPELQFIAGFGYADSVVDDWETDTGSDYSGNKVPWAPKFTYNFGVEYNHKNGFFANADLLGTGEQYYDAANELRGDGYETVNLRTGYQTEDIELSVWCNNLFDEEYAVKKVSTASGTLQEDGAPRTFGFTINWRF